MPGSLPKITLPGGVKRGSLPGGSHPLLPTKPPKHVMFAPLNEDWQIWLGTTPSNPLRRGPRRWPFGGGIRGILPGGSWWGGCGKDPDHQPWWVWLGGEIKF